MRVEDQAHRAGFELIREPATRTSIESWCSTVRSEEAERLESYAHAKEALFDYIEVLSNQRRRHSTLGQISPAEFERRTTHGA